MARRPPAIELRHLNTFVVVAEHGSFRKAGAAIGLSQSAVSRCIADLEDQFGASLFHPAHLGDLADPCRATVPWTGKTNSQKR